MPYKHHKDVPTTKSFMECRGGMRNKSWVSAFTCYSSSYLGRTSYLRRAAVPIPITRSSARSRTRSFGKRSHRGKRLPGLSPLDYLR